MGWRLVERVDLLYGDKLERAPMALLKGMAKVALDDAQPGRPAGRYYAGADARAAILYRDLPDRPDDDDTSPQAVAARRKWANALHNTRRHLATLQRAGAITCKRRARPGQHQEFQINSGREDAPSGDAGAEMAAPRRPPFSGSDRGANDGRSTRAVGLSGPTEYPSKHPQSGGPSAADLVAAEWSPRDHPTATQGVTRNNQEQENPPSVELSSYVARDTSHDNRGKDDDHHDDDVRERLMAYGVPATALVTELRAEHPDVPGPDLYRRALRVLEAAHAARDNSHRKRLT